MNAMIVFEGYIFLRDHVKTIVTSTDPIAPVGYLKVEKAHLESKTSSCMFSN